MAITSYCTVSEVEESLKLPLGFFQDVPSATKPSLSEVEKIIKDVASEIDAAADKAGYTIPITGEKALQIVRGYSLTGVSGRVEEILWAEVGKPNQAPRQETRSRQFEKALLRLSGHGITLVDQPKATSSSHRLPRSYGQEHADDADMAPVVTRGMIQ